MSKEPIDISGRVIAITGAARGIGLATARALHRGGAKIAIGDIDADEAIRAAQGLGGDVLSSPLDVTDARSFRSFLELTERELGPLEVLINNAGIMPIGPFLDESDATAARVFEINVLGVMTGMRLALPGMLQRSRGHIVNISSVAGRSPVPGGASYAASKAAIVSLTETARVEFAGRGISFTCVMPSFTATDLIAGTKGTRFVPTVQPEDVADAIARAVAGPVPDVFVPSSVGFIIKTQPLLGRKLRDSINHALGADRTFLEVDQAARAAYASRIAPPAKSEPASAHAEAHPARDAQ
jgi:NAD(P)-dependent dehydrogenase (short-subunit alcohol dehydrogenase family)